MRTLPDKCLVKRSCVELLERLEPVKVKVLRHKGASMRIWNRPDNGDGRVEVDLDRMSEPEQTKENKCGPHHEGLTLRALLARYGFGRRTAPVPPYSTAHCWHIVHTSIVRSRHRYVGAVCESGD